MKNIVKVYKILIVISMFLAIFVGYTTSKDYYLVISDRKTDKKWEYKLKDKNFSLGYIHSVMKTEAEELFSVEEKSKCIVLTKTIYSSYGVGLPFLPEEGKLEVKDGKFILNINRKFKEINMVVSPLAKHYLKINKKKYMLSDVFGGEVKNINLKIIKK